MSPGTRSGESPKCTKNCMSLKFFRWEARDIACYEKCVCLLIAKVQLQPKEPWSPCFKFQCSSVVFIVTLRNFEFVHVTQASHAEKRRGHLLLSTYGLLLCSQQKGIASKALLDQIPIELFPCILGQALASERYPNPEISC